MFPKAVERDQIEWMSAVIGFRGRLHGTDFAGESCRFLGSLAVAAPGNQRYGVLFYRGLRSGERRLGRVWFPKVDGSSAIRRRRWRIRFRWRRDGGSLSVEEFFRPMFESITRRFSGILGGLTRRRISEKNIRETLREVRVALLEADVALEVVKEFLQRVEEQALGEEVLKGVNPGQQFIAVVHREMVRLMEPEDSSIRYKEKGPTVILMAGLQGSGKTTTCGKLAYLLRKKDKRKPLLVAADVQRPAAIEQLKTLGRQLDVPVYSEAGAKPPSICENAVREAKKNGCDTVILDTAGRLHIDEEMMKEVSQVAKQTRPDEVFLVCDAMVGQDAVRSAREFNERLELSGVILTKLDGDARGGAALSVKSVTGKPIKFYGDGEKLEGSLKPFSPASMADRVLGYGDVRELVRTAQDVVDQKEAEKMQDKLLSASFTLDDFLKQMGMVKKMGSMRDLMKMIPGIGAHVDDMGFDDKDFGRIEAVIQSMTPRERARPEILNTLRRERIARGAGVQRMDVDDLLKQFSMMRKMMGEMSQAGGKGPFGKIKALKQAKQKMADMGGMMEQMAKVAQAEEPRVPGAATQGEHPGRATLA